MRKMILSQPNINYMMNMTKKFLNGKIDDIAYTLDFPYELEKRYEKMHSGSCQVVCRKNL